MKPAEVGNELKTAFPLSLCSIISCFVFNSSLVEEDNDSFGCDALELDGKQENIT